MGKRPTRYPAAPERDVAAAAAGDRAARSRMYQHRSRANKRAAEIAQWDKENARVSSTSSSSSGADSALDSPPTDDLPDDSDDLPGDLGDFSGPSGITQRYVFFLVVAECACAFDTRTHALVGLGVCSERGTPRAHQHLRV